MSMIFIESPSTNPAFNLALEQYVFDSMDKSHEYFMFWQNDNAIIVGKNQNTIEEINSIYVHEHDIKVVRRLSGGGAVYHDMGNLNFTFIVNASSGSEMDLNKFSSIVAKALNNIGIPATAEGRNDIQIDGKKFSGNAQYVKGNRIMHHGTLMFSSNMQILSEALQVSESKIKSKGIKSVRSRVTTISQHLPSPMSLKTFKEHLISQLFANAVITPYTLTADDTKAIEQLQQDVYELWEWNYGRSPEYNIRKKRRFPNCGEIELFMNVEHGTITAFQAYGDYFSQKDMKQLESLLQNTRLIEEELLQTLADTDISHYFNCLTKKEFIDFLLT